METRLEPTLQDMLTSFHRVRSDWIHGLTFIHTLRLAHGNCKCRKETGPKGVPRCIVPWDSKGDNIDLFPEGLLWERGCTIERGSRHCIRSPTGRVVDIKVWGHLPYITKDDLHVILSDLPEAEVPGRAGTMGGQPTAARDSRASSQQELIREQLQHLTETHTKYERNKIAYKYRHLPDVYYKDQRDQIVTPEKFEEEYIQKAEAETLFVHETDFRKRFVTLPATQSHLWPRVRRRVTYNRDTGELLADESVQEQGNWSLYRPS